MARVAFLIGTLRVRFRLHTKRQENATWLSSVALPMCSIVY